MNNFPDSEEEFYRLRDDRTDRCTGNRAYQVVDCAVSLSAGTAKTLSGQVMLLAASNLLSRWCRKVTLVLQPVSTHAALGFGMTDLANEVLWQMRDANPFGTFDVAQGHITSHIAIVIGEPNSQVSAATSVFIDASGWLASIGRESQIKLPTTEDRNCLGAIAAACFGTAQAFKVALGLPADRFFRDGIFDLFSMNWVEPGPASNSLLWPDDLNIGRILMVGAGSVGSSTTYCMRLAGLAGRITIIDKDLVKVENFNRSPISGRGLYGLTKSEAASNFLRGALLIAQPLAIWWDEFVLQLNRKDFDFDVWLPLANEFNVRFSMQNNLPPLMIHASTTVNWGVNHGRHVPGRDDCLADRFPQEVSTQDLTCATGQVESQQGSVDAALPFSSVFAGLLITADLVRTQLPEYPQVPNFALFDWYGSLETIQAWDRKPRTNCICTQQSRALNEQFNGRTKYWNLWPVASTTI